MDENYDEFGNYIGPDMPEINAEEEEMDSSKDININQQAFQNIANSKYSYNEDENSDEDLSDEKTEKNPNVHGIEINPNQIITEENNYKVTLNEEKELYKDADELFPDAENLVMEEDAQPISVPIIAPKKENKLDLFETKMPDLNFNLEFLAHLMTKPKLVRNIAIVGSLLHGKTTFMDMFIHLTHNNSNVIKYLDNREDEQKRKISLKSSPISLVLQNSEGKSFLFNFIDTPGHSNFFDEVQSALRMVDGVIIVIDVLEGITLQTEKVIKECIKENLDIVILLNKIDRFILELKIPPNDAYFKIKFIIDEFNKIVIENEIYNLNKTKKYFIHPNSGNVLFGASKYNVVFSLESLANKLYNNKNKNNKINLDYKKFAKFFCFNTDCFVIGYDITKKESFENIKSYWYPTSKKFSGLNLFYLIGNKIDLIVQEAVSELEAREYAKNNNMRFFLTSCLNNTGIKEFVEDLAEELEQF